METSLERIRIKIAELEAKIGNLRIAERELLALERPLVQKTKVVAKPETKPERAPKRIAAASGPKEKPQTMGAAVIGVLDQDTLSVAEIAERVAATGRQIDNRAISFTLQALKKRNLVKNLDGKWATVKPRSK
jgi:hypothetical protein